MIRPREPQRVADFLFLEVGHVTRDALAARRSDTVIGVRRDIDRFARVARRALLVGEPPRQRLAVDVAVPLAMRIVASHAVQGPVEVAIAGQVIHLIGEGPHPQVGEKRFITDERRQQRIVTLQILARQVSGRDNALQRVALEAHFE